MKAFVILYNPAINHSMLFTKREDGRYHPTIAGGERTYSVTAHAIQMTIETYNHTERPLVLMEGDTMEELYTNHLKDML